MSEKYFCIECGHEITGYMGKCPGCKSFGTMEPISSVVKAKKGKSAKVSNGLNLSSGEKPNKLKDVEINAMDRLKTDIGEFDRVMGGGIVIDSVNVLTAPPGTGKSTLLLDIANTLALKGNSVLYLSGEESESQIKLRANRILKNISDNLYVKAETNLEQIEMDIKQIKPNLLIIDSIQTIHSYLIPEAMPGGTKQMNYCASKILTLAKEPESPMAVFFVGQMTKEDELRGSREFEHMVDGVFKLEGGDEGETLKLLKANKNRFGSAEEVGLFEMLECGLVEVKDPSKYFINEREALVSGIGLTCIKEGSRNIVIEVESLIEANKFSFPMRVGQGITKDKLQILVAILNNRAGVNLKQHDLYIKLSNGIKTKDESTSLAILASIYSVAHNIAIDDKTVFIGDVSLTGELRRVPNLEGRLRDLDRMGFKKVYIPKNNISTKLDLKNLKIIEKNTVREVLEDIDGEKK